jgi:type I restriction enzyme S subunit
LKSSYKRIGDYIELVDERNKELNVDLLLGLSISKQFIPSVANTVGADMSNYKIIKKGQFACSIMQVRRDGKMPIALLQDFDEAIISQAYPVFRVIDENKLLPEYLMMWFSRSEFDRQATFHAVGGVRGSLEWDDFLDFELPIPSIEKQQEIVTEYNTITNRIALNEQLNQKLEETAQGIYKNWFVDFEFPNEEGKPYKSSGGRMEYNDELDKEIPDLWLVETVKEFCFDMKSGGTPSRSNYEYWDNKDVPWLKTGEIKNNIILSTKEYISFKGLENSSAKLLPKDTVLMSMYGANAGEIALLKIETTTNQACCGMICKDLLDASFLYYHLLVNQDYNYSQAIGGAQQNLSKDYIENIKLVVPKNLNVSFFKTIINEKEINTKLILKLLILKSLLLSKMTKVEESIYS